MSRYMRIRSDDSIIYDEERRNEALCIGDAFIDLMTHGADYSEVIGTLEMSGALSPKEARHFLGISERRQLTLGEAETPLLLVPGAPLVLQKVDIFGRRITNSAIAWSSLWGSQE